MELNQEKDIRNYVEARLKQKGIAAEREVVCGNGIRADLVTADTVIEIKKQLNRGAIYQAHGQGVAYQKLLHKPKLIIIGLAPTSESRYQEAKRIAENIQADNVEVVFIDKDPRWGLAQSISPVVDPKVVDPKVVDPKTVSRSTVQLPFDQSAAAPKRSAQQKASSPSHATDRPTQTPNKTDEKSAGVSDFWILLLLILGFIWVKLALERVEPSPQLPQPNREIVSPSEL